MMRKKRFKDYSINKPGTHAEVKKKKICAEDKRQTKVLCDKTRDANHVSGIMCMETGTKTPFNNSKQKQYQ